MLSDYYKNNPTDQIWWIDNLDRVGDYYFSFDKKVIYDLLTDYPYKLTPEQKEIFDKENPYWADFYKYRTKERVSYKGICEKLGYDPFVYPYKLAIKGFHDDSLTNPYSVLDDDEIYLLEQIAMATENIRHELQNYIRTK